MQIINDYTYLFQNMVGTSKQPQVNDIKVSQLGSNAVKSKLVAAGIDVNSAQYKSAIKSMKSHPGSSGMLTNVQAIKNLMNTYDKNGDEIDPTTGLTGVFVTEETAAKRRRIVNIPESSRDEVYKLVRKNFEKNNGMTDEADGKSEIFTNLQRKTNKNDRLAATWTLSQYEQAYAKAFVSAAKNADPNWNYGKPVPKGAFEGITRESIEANMSKSTRGTIDLRL